MYDEMEHAANLIDQYVRCMRSLLAVGPELAGHPWLEQCRNAAYEAWYFMRSSERERAARELESLAAGDRPRV